MRVFISWSGERSHAVAGALAELLPDVLQDAHTWMSAHDIEAGTRWGADLDRELESSNFGILCLTPENLRSPWLLFEAGSLAKSVSTSRVVPYRLGLKPTDVEYPLAQFQGVDANRDGTFKLLSSLNAAREAPLSKDRLGRMFERWWPDLETKLDKLPGASAERVDQRDDRVLLEEILQLVRRGSALTFDVDSVPKTSVWKTLYDVTKYSEMDFATLRRFLEALNTRYRETPHLGEVDALESKIWAVEQELASRKPSFAEAQARDEQTGGKSG